MALNLDQANITVIRPEYVGLPHDEFKEMSIFEKATKGNHVIFDVKHMFSADQVNGTL